MNVYTECMCVCDVCVCVCYVSVCVCVCGCICVCVFWLPFSLITPVASGKWQRVQGTGGNTVWQLWVRNLRARLNMLIMR